MKVNDCLLTVSYIIIMQVIEYKTFSSQFFPQSQTDNTWNRFIMAIENDRVDLLESISHQGTQIIGKDSNGKNLLFYAVYHKAALCTMFLLRRGINIKDLDSQNKNIYHLICYSGSLQCLQNVQFYLKLVKIQKLHEQMMGLLAHYGYKRTDMKSGCLKYSVSAKREELFKELQREATSLYRKYLFEYLRQMDESLLQRQQRDSRNPVHLGCLNKYQKCLHTLEYLIQSFGNPDLSFDGETLNHFEMVQGFFEEKIDPRNYVDTLPCLRDILIENVRYQIEREFEKESKKKIKQILNAKDKDERSSLFIASKNGSTSMINFLQKYAPSPKIDEKQEIMKVALNNLARKRIIDLCEASKLSDPKPLNFLISCGEEVNEKKTVFGTFALLEALKSYKSQKSLETFKTLIKSGADVNTQDTNGWTALHHASSLGYKQVVELLLDKAKENKMQVHKVTNKRYHALHLASMNEHPEVIELLINHPNSKANINVADWDGCTPLIHAAKKGSINVLKVLLDLKANMYAGDARQMNALHHAAFSNHPACIRLLLNYDSDFDKLREMRNSKGKLPKDLCTNTSPFENIFTAARTGNVNLIRKLTSDKPDLKDSTTMDKQRTPLILAVLGKSLVSAKFLVDIGADTYHEDKQGKSVNDYCDEMLSKARKEKDQSGIKLMEQIKRLLE